MGAKLEAEPELQKFLDQAVVGTLAVPINSDGTLHGATLHYWYTVSPFAFYFVTGRNSEKCQLLKTQPTIPATYVIGTTLDTPFTVQMRGTLTEASDDDLNNYFKKRGEHLKGTDSEKNICLLFTPTWVRFSDFGKEYRSLLLDLA